MPKKEPKTYKKDLIKTKTGTADPGKDPAPDVVENLYITCLEYAEKYINALDDPAEIKTNNGLFVDMLKYIYINYLVDILKNDTYTHYDYDLLDKIFYIYVHLVYKYKHNKRATVLEFTIFVNISRQQVYNAAMGLSKKLNSKQVDIVKKWFSECENSLTNNNTVFDMFLLKSHPVYRYNDNLSPVPIESQHALLSVEQLPDLSPGKIAIIDNNSDPNT